MLLDVDEVFELTVNYSQEVVALLQGLAFLLKELLLRIRSGKVLVFFVILGAFSF